MKVRKGSWHYEMVKHKNFVSHAKKNNSSAMEYLIEVFITLYLYSMIISAVLALFVTIAHHDDPSKGSIVLGLVHSNWIWVAVIVFFSALWVPLLSFIIEPFLPKEWKRLEIIP